MNPFVLLFADGTVFFIGMFLAVAAVSSARWLSQQGRPRVWFVGSVLGIMLVLISSTPLPVWTLGSWLALCVSVLILSASNTVDAANRTVARLYRVCLTLFVGLSVLFCILELPYRASPKIEVAPGSTIYVVGDSISAGIRSEERTWPDVLAEEADLAVVNLARPGATAGSAFAQAQRIPAGPALVIVEIGGNDLLGGTETEDFGASLDALLAKLDSDGHRIVMFELPLPPFHAGFARVQRHLARQYHARLIPKRCLSRVLGSKDSTVDGLHLSQSGHDALAGAVRRMFVAAPNGGCRWNERSSSIVRGISVLNGPKTGRLFAERTTTIGCDTL